ncbi:hypothetical protein CPC08DRAFT_705622 [Agrocybe pediades]|nr:hypothetical protein CPC08DRAFT_705622 [Agrocybe pediades]
MLSKVSKQIRRRSVQLSSSPLSETRTNREVVQCAPDLLRWGDFLDPFPVVAPGGYKRYYASSTSAFPQSPSFNPILSHCPEPSSSFSNRPATSLLFSPPSPIDIKPERCLGIIHEASLESMAPRTAAPPLRNRVSSNASSSNNGHPVSLRRIRRQLLRTPSIERDFPATPTHTRHLSEPSNISCATYETSSSTTGTTGLHQLHRMPLSHAGPRPTRSHSESSGSSQSNSSSGHSEYGPITPVMPLTPSTSTDGYEGVGGNGGGGVMKLKIANSNVMDNVKVAEAEDDSDNESMREFVGRLFQMGLVSPMEEIMDPLKRPDSRTSFNTAKTDFEDVDGADSDDDGGGGYAHHGSS